MAEVELGFGKAPCRAMEKEGALREPAFQPF